MYMTKTGELAATFTIPGNNAVRSIAFSENGYWFAGAAQNSPQVTVFDLRKEGDAAIAKTLEIGDAVQSLAWDYSQQFLATAGPGGVTIQQYSKSSKKWSEAARKDFASVSVKWGQNARQLVVVAQDGKVGVLEPAAQ
jgi:pre-mRNA-processing factor 19